jgi:hypothetical protein
MVVTARNVLLIWYVQAKGFFIVVSQSVPKYYRLMMRNSRHPARRCADLILV